MASRLALSLVLSSSLGLLIGCGDGGGDGSTCQAGSYLCPCLAGACQGGLLCQNNFCIDPNSDGTDGPGDGDPGDGDPGDGDPGDGDPGDGDPGDGDPGDGDPGDGDPGDGDPGDGDPGDGDGDPNVCMIWEIVYDLDGSEFEISDTPLGEGDQVNLVASPYGSDDHVGPGEFVLRFRDIGGEPGEAVFMYSYEMALDYVTTGGIMTMSTMLEDSAGPEDCGITEATLNGATASWSPLAIVDHHSVGSILCEGPFCEIVGLLDGVPEPVDEITDHPLAPFTFSEGFSTFVADTFIVQADDNSTTTWAFQGTELDRELIIGPDCLCQ